MSCELGSALRDKVIRRRRFSKRNGDGCGQLLSSRFGESLDRGNASRLTTGVLSLREHDDVGIACASPDDFLSVSLTFDRL